MELTPSERDFFARANGRLPLSVTPHFFDRIDPADPADPLRRQVFPRAWQLETAADEKSDPLGEERDSPVPALVHRYPDRVLLLANSVCASHCRFCTRERFVAGTPPDWRQALDYIRAHGEIRDVLISGGDPLLLGDEKLAGLLEKLRGIAHVEFIRIGSRVPIFLPQRITPALVGIFKKYGPLYLSLHVNHPRELSPETASALEQLAFAGTVFGSQTVLLRGVNDDAALLKKLFHRLLQLRVRPYYLYACDKVPGSAGWRVPVARGIELMRSLRGWTSGYALPQFVIDLPDGGGKVPVGSDYLQEIADGGICRLRNFRGNDYFY